MKDKICSNRTFMELKWTRVNEEIRKQISSNRTFMELKWACSSFCGNAASTSSNRTFMELK